MSGFEIAGALIALALLVWLVAVLLNPERWS